MHVSAWVNVQDLISIDKTFLEKIIANVLKGEKSVMFQTQPLSLILPTLKKSGVDGLELLVPIRTTDRNIKSIQEIVKEYHLPVRSIHQSLDSFANISLTEINRLCEIANIFSAGVITLHSNAVGKRLFKTDFISTLKKLQVQQNIKFGIENLPKSPFTLSKPYTWKTEEFSEILEEADLCMTFDTTHLGQVGEDICDFYVRNKERIINIHLSNYRKHWLNTRLYLVQETHLPLSKGELPIGKLLKLLKDTHYSGLITMEINANLNGLCDSARKINGYAS